MAIFEAVRSFWGSASVFSIGRCLFQAGVSQVKSRLRRWKDDRSFPFHKKRVMLKESVLLWGFEPCTLLPHTYSHECHRDVQLIVRRVATGNFSLVWEFLNFLHIFLVLPGEKPLISDKTTNTGCFLLQTSLCLSSCCFRNALVAVMYVWSLVMCCCCFSFFYKQTCFNPKTWAVFVFSLSQEAA